jgi:hypothetical protein
MLFGKRNDKNTEKKGEVINWKKCSFETQNKQQQHNHSQHFSRQFSLQHFSSLSLISLWSNHSIPARFAADFFLSTLFLTAYPPLLASLFFFYSSTPLLLYSSTPLLLHHSSSLFLPFLSVGHTLTHPSSTSAIQ